MKTRFLTLGVALGFTALARADFTPIAINPSSFNGDPVIEAATPKTFNDVVTVTPDGGTNKTGNTWYEVGYMTNTTGLPAHNSTITTNSHTWQMPPDYHTNCVFFVGHNQGTWSPIVGPATATFTTPAAFTTLSFLSGSGNGPCLILYTIHYQGGTTEQGTFSSTDWFSNSGANRAYDARGLVSLNGAVNNQSANHGVLFYADVILANPSLNITSIDFQWYGQNAAQNPWQNGRTFIYAVAGSTDGLTFSPIAVSGYNQDGVVEADGPQTANAAAPAITGTLTNDNTYCSFTMDGGTSKQNWTWMERGYYATCPNAGLPAPGSTITSATLSAIHYTMPSTYVGNCAICLASNIPTANINFQTPAAYGGLSLLLGDGNGVINVRTEIQFADGSTETNWISGIDWFNRTVPYAYVNFGQTWPAARAVRNAPDQFPNYFLPGYVDPFIRDPRNGGQATPNVPNIRLFDVQLPVANSSGQITNISLNLTNTGAFNTTMAIFAISGNAGSAPSITQPLSIVTDSATAAIIRYSTNGNALSGANNITNTAILNDINITRGWQGTNNITLSVSNRLGNVVSYQWKRAPRGGGWRDIFDTFDMSTFANVAGPNIAGATSNVLTISNATLADSADYLVVASNPYGSFTSFVATVQVLTTNVGLLLGTGAGDVITKFSGDGTSGNGQETFDKAIDQTQQKWLSTGLGSTGFGGATINPGTVPFVGPIGYVVTPVSGASFLTGIRFYSANDTPGRDPRDYFVEGSNDGSTWTPIIGGQLLGTLMLPTTRDAGGTANLNNPLVNPSTEIDFANATSYKSYRVTITNVVEPFATPLMQIAEIEMLGTFVPAPPTWVREPEPGVTVFAGTSPSFSVKASGLGALAPKYQWYKNAGTAIAGATSSSYTLVNAQLTDSGTTFYCVATNNFGTITSSAGTLTVIAAPTQSYPSAVLANSPKYYWRLDEPDNAAGNNGVVAHDYAGGRNGYFSNTVNGVLGYNPNSDPDTAMQVGTANDQVVAGINDVDFARASGAAAFTIEAWVFGGNQNINDSAIITKGYNGALNVGTGTGTEQYVLDVSGGAPRKFRFLIRSATGQGYAAQSQVNPYDPVALQPIWRHVVGVCDQPNGNIYLYVDGLLAATASIPTNAGILNQSLPTVIGSRQSTAAADYDNQWNGTIDEVAVYGSALSASQVLNHFYAAQRPPIITLQPTNQTKPENVNVTFNTSAYGPGTLGYQWYLSDGVNPTAPVAGQTSPNLSFNTSVSQSGNNYQLIVTNQYGATTSAVATLTVIGGVPSFATDIPTAQTYLVGHVIQLKVDVLGTAPFTYQWKKDGVNLVDDYRISGSQTNLLTIGYATNTDSGNYQVIVSNGQGSTPSSTDVILVTNVNGQVAVPFNAARNGWSYQLTGTGAGQGGMSNNAVTLTVNAGGTQGSCFMSNKVDISSFTASFIYVDVTGINGADGVTFCVQNDARGVTALGGGGGNLGYSGITPSVGFAINIYDPQTRGISLFQGGTVVTPFFSANPVPIGANNDPIHVNLIYSGGVLQATLNDLVSAATFATNYTIDIPTVVGGNQAYIGFTGADGGVASTQIISNFTMSPPAVKILSKTVGNSLVLNWPASAGAFLRSTPTLASPVWSYDTSPFLVVSNQAQVTISPLQGNKFYRLDIYP